MKLMANLETMSRTVNRSGGFLRFASGCSLKAALAAVVLLNVGCGADSASTSTAQKPQTLASQSGALSFESASYYAGLWPKSVVAADFDGDGHVDIAVSNRGPINNDGVVPEGASAEDTYQIRLYFGNGWGDFELREDRAPTIQPDGFAYYMVQGDVNADGRPELIAGIVPDRLGQELPRVLIYRNISDGSGTGPVFDFGDPLRLDPSCLAPTCSPGFQGRPSPARSDGTPLIAITLENFDNDSRPDLVMMHKQTDTVDVFKNVGAGGASPSFERTQSFVLPPSVVMPASFNSPWKSVATDLDGDGRKDIAFVQAKDWHLQSNPGAKGSVGFLMNVSDDAFPWFQLSHVEVQVDELPYDIAVGALRGAGSKDLVVANAHGQTLSFINNNSWPGTLAFDQPVRRRAGRASKTLAIADFNGDCLDDVIVANQTGTDFTDIAVDGESAPLVAYLNDPWAPGEYYTRDAIVGSQVPGLYVSGSNSAAGPVGIKQADVNNDGLPDLVAASGGNGGSKLFVLLNTSTSSCGW
jgi:hypothetical protein